MPSQATPALKLWYSPGACSFAPHVLLLEAGLDFQLVLSQVGSFTDEFMALNPKGRVPVLAMDDEVITEMPAVLTAISSLVPDRKFLGQTTLETIRVYEWLNYLSGTLHGQGYGASFRPERYVDDPKLYPIVQKKGLQTIKECYTVIENKLTAAGSEYAVGNSFTIVDPFLLVLYRWASRLDIDMEADYPRYATWANRHWKRESVISALKVHVKV
ncbi:glutathione S-transferase [Xylogone sp. PMI_703]|nr:glutathione S-transferase [Xylogone sp. PMI_703]